MFEQHGSVLCLFLKLNLDIHKALYLASNLYPYVPEYEDDNGYVCERHVLAKDTLKKIVRANWGILR